MTSTEVSIFNIIMFPFLVIRCFFAWMDYYSSDMQQLRRKHTHAWLIANNHDYAQMIWSINALRYFGNLDALDKHKYDKVV